MNKPEAIKIIRNYLAHIGPTWDLSEEGRQYKRTFEQAVNALNAQANLPLPAVPIPHDPLALERAMREQEGTPITAFAVSHDSVFSVVQFHKKQFKTFQYIRDPYNNKWTSNVLADTKDVTQALGCLESAMPIQTI